MGTQFACCGARKLRISMYLCHTVIYSASRNICYIKATTAEPVEPLQRQAVYFSALYTSEPFNPCIHIHTYIYIYIHTHTLPCLLSDHVPPLCLHAENGASPLYNTPDTQLTQARNSSSVHQHIPRIYEAVADTRAVCVPPGPGFAQQEARENEHCEQCKYRGCRQGPS